MLKIWLNSSPTQKVLVLVKIWGCLFKRPFFTTGLWKNCSFLGLKKKKISDEFCSYGLLYVSIIYVSIYISSRHTFFSWTLFFSYMPCNLTTLYYYRENSEESEKAVTKLNSSLNAQSDIAVKPEWNISVSFNRCYLVGRRASYSYFNNCLKVRSGNLGSLSTHTQTTGNNPLGEGKHQWKEKRL